VCFAKDIKKAKEHNIHAHEYGSVDDMASCMKEVECLLLIPPSGEDKVEVSCKYMEAAKKAKVKNIMFVSTMMPRDHKHMKECRRLNDFWELERKVKECGFEKVCIVRLAFFMENLLLFRERILQRSLPLPLGPEDAMAMVCLHDSALGIVELYKRWIGQQGSPSQLIEFTGHAWTPPQMARSLSHITGKHITPEQVQDDDAKRMLSKSPLDKAEQELVLEMYKLAREGRLNWTTDDLEKLIGKEHVTTGERFFTQHKVELGG